MSNINFDGHKLNFHAERTAAWLRGEEVYPIYVEIGPVSSCNHRCIFCALDFARSNKVLDTKVLCRALEDMGRNNVKAVMFGGEGEPTLHKDFPLIVRSAKESGLDVALTTNGVPFTRRKIEQCLGYLSWVKVSIDAGNSESYAKIHGTEPQDFNILMDNIGIMVETRNKHHYSTTIGTQILLMGENINEVLPLVEKVKAIGVDYLVVKPYSQHPSSSNKFDLDYSRFKCLEADLEKFKSEKFNVFFRSEAMEKSKLGIEYSECYGLPFFTLIDAQGNIIPCNLFYNREEYYYGNLYKNSFSDIWKSNQKKQAVEKICNAGTSVCRKNCRLNYVNQYLYMLKNPPKHVNFI